MPWRVVTGSTVEKIRSLREKVRRPIGRSGPGVAATPPRALRSPSTRARFAPPGLRVTAWTGPPANTREPPGTLPALMLAWNGDHSGRAGDEGGTRAEHEAPVEQDGTGLAAPR